MEPVKKILVPVDFSEFSLNSLKYAVGFAAHFDAEIFLLYVMEPVNYYQDPAGVFMDRFDEVEREIESEPLAVIMMKMAFLKFVLRIIQKI